MNFKYCLCGFKTFKNNAKEIFDFRDFLSIIALFFSIGMMLSKFGGEFVKKIKTLCLLLSLISAIPAIIKTVVAVLAGISEYKNS